jgi:uroporphyrin-III C-methyltransferase/precorrin-2 dehydrogenase/sirohydrochlorin ferrochelatase
MAHGLDPATPAALIENGTYQHQRTIAATVATLPGLVPDQRLLGPALIVIGEVVGLRARLAWLVERADDPALATGKAE